MSRATKYNTKQKQEITAYLKTVAGKKVTASDIGNQLSSSGITVGTATIYRHLEQLVANGMVKKYFVDGNASACFEYVGTSETDNGKPFFYLKCEKCGKLIRFECHELVHIQNHLFSDHGFRLNFARTILYGICDQCEQQ